MKIIEETQNRLTIEDRPLFLWVMFFGLGAAALVSALTGRVEGAFETVLVGALGVFAIWVGWRFEPYQRFEFERETNTFTHRLRRVTGSATWTRSISEIERAVDEGNWDDGARSARVTLMTTGGPYPLESGFSGFDRSATVDTINRWLGVVS